jgi:hypothetical protein
MKHDSGNDNSLGVGAVCVDNSFRHRMRTALPLRHDPAPRLLQHRLAQDFEVGRSAMIAVKRDSVGSEAIPDPSSRVSPAAELTAKRKAGSSRRASASLWSRQPCAASSTQVRISQARSRVYQACCEGRSGALSSTTQCRCVPAPRAGAPPRGRQSGAPIGFRPATSC